MVIKISVGEPNGSGGSFSNKLIERGLENIMLSMVERMHGKASAVVDPESGKHLPVFVRRVGKDSISIHASGSKAYVRAVEQKLGIKEGEIQGMSEPINQKRLVYLAHASEDKYIVEPVARGLMERGIEVWYDNWEIGPGDSLRRKMEKGLGDCTHFVVFLTNVSTKKAWVAEEIDAGLMATVEGVAKFIGLRHQLPLSEVSPLLRTKLTPEFYPGAEGLDDLAAAVLGISKKPPLGKRPSYLNRHVPGSPWSSSARVVAEYFVRNSEFGSEMDPEASYSDIQKKTGLPMPDVRIGVLDLYGSGLLNKHEYINSEDIIFPKSELFVVFDGDFMDWNPEADGKELARYLFNLQSDVANSSIVAKEIGWGPRRFNPAAAYLIAARVVEEINYIG